MATKCDSSPLVCCLCYDSKRSRDPRRLPCGHSFCLTCLQRWYDARVAHVRQSRHQLECPICNMAATVPAEGVPAFPHDESCDFHEASEDIIDADDVHSLSHELLCQKCSQTGVSRSINALCRNCARRFCMECALQHVQIPVFSDHSLVYDLCRKHGADVSYLCLTCIEKLCVDCAIADKHMDHTMCSLSKCGMIIQPGIQEKQIKLQYMLDDIEKELDKEVTKASTLTHARHTLLKSSWEMVRSSMDDHISKLIKIHETQHEDSVDAVYRAYREACAEGRRIIEETHKMLPECTVDSLETVKKVRAQLDECIEKTRARGNIPRVHMVSASMCHVQKLEEALHSLQACELPCQVFRCADPQPMPVPEQLLAVECGPSQDIHVPVKVHALPCASVLVCEQDMRAAHLIKTDGTITKPYGSNRVRAAFIEGTDVYLVPLDGACVVKLTPRCPITIIGICPAVPKLQQFVVDDDMIFLLNKNGIEKRPLRKGSGRQQVINGTFNSFIRVTLGSSCQYICTNPQSHEICIFDESGVLQRKFGGFGSGDGQLNYPSCVTILINGNLLVVDCENHRLVEFQLDGTFVRNLVTQEDHLYCPRAIAYKHPFLWVTQNDIFHESGPMACVKLFKFQD